MSSNPEAQIPNLRSLGPRLLLDGLVPQATFLALNWTLGLRWGIAAATVISVALATYRKRRGQSIGWILPVSAGFILVRGTAGILTQSDVVYFGPGIANNFIIGALFIGSVFVRRPIVAYIVPTFYPLT
ncbi:MAG: DUF3159 domain-containing protein, partial [Acidimicrobiia bacterium]